jgi:hypothetical protein
MPQAVQLHGENDTPNIAKNPLARADGFASLEE